MDKEITMKEESKPNSWGYAICFGTIITFVAGIGHINSFGLIYNDFVTDTKSTTKSLTTSHGVFAIMLAVGGIILNSVKKKFSLRTGGIIGAILLSTGSLSTIFISNANQLPFTFGILQGIGFGMITPVCYSHINYYFEKKRTTVMSLCKAIQGMIIMWYPQLVKEILLTYGFKGTLLIIAGISFHTFPGMITMTTDKKPQKKRTANELESGCNKQESHNLLELNENGSRSDVISQSNSLFRKLRTKFEELISVKMLKDVIYCNICVGQSFVNFSDLTFFILQPMLLFQYKYDKTQVAACISIGTAADVGGRCLLAALSNFMQVNTRLLFYLATLFTFIIRLVMLQITEFLWMAIITGVLGILRGWLHVASPLVISSHVSHENFPGAYALFMLATGLVNVTCSPLIGLLKDIYKDYVPTFYVLTFCCIPCLLLWPIEHIARTK